MSQLTEQQEQSIERSSTDLDNALILETLARAISDNGSLRNEHDYLMERATYYNEHGNSILKEAFAKD